jgi:hypothetical protein
MASVKLNMSPQHDVIKVPNTKFNEIRPQLPSAKETYGQMDMKKVKGALRF